LSMISPAARARLRVADCGPMQTLKGDVI
jgi:hypothetical protein